MISSRFAVALGLSVLLAACTKQQETTTATTATQSVNTSATQPAPATTSSAPAPAPQTAAAGTLGSTEGEKSGVRIDITELKRASGGTLNLKFTIVNNSSDEVNTASEYFGDHDVTRDSYRNVSGIHLIDPVNKKKYYVVTDAEKHCVCSTDIANIKAGQKVNLWAKFPAPPADVQKVSIEIPHFQPLDDVAIQ